MVSFTIKPKKGLVIRDPETLEVLVESGEVKPKTSYWLNHLKAGDIEIVAESKKNSKKEGK